MKKYVSIAVLAVAAGFLAACDLIPTILGVLLLLLGVSPAQGFSDPGSSQYGQVGLAITGQNESGVPGLVAADAIEVESDDSECDVDGVTDTPGHSKGSFVMLVDDSGSTEIATAADCEGCPTDPNRMRVQAVQALTKELSKQAPDWRIALMDFGSDNPTAPLAVTHELSGFSTDPEATITAADSLVSVGGTPLWDSVSEVLGTLKADVSQNFQTDADPDVGWGIVVLSDGQDTGSSATVEQVIEQAKSLGIAVHTVGLGGAADTGGGANFSTVHVEQLRKLAEETGGFYGSVEVPEELPELYKKIAMSLVGGYQQVEVRFKNPPPSGSPVAGRIGLRGTGIKVPFKFTAP